MRAEAIQHAPKSLKQAPRATRNAATQAPYLPLIQAPKLKILFTFALFGLRKSRGNTKPLQRILNFCPFLAYFEPFCPVRSAPNSPEMQGSPQPHNPTGPEAHKDRGTKGKEGNEPTSDQQGRNRRKGREAQHHQQDEEHNKPSRPDGLRCSRWCRSAPDAVSLSSRMQEGTEAHKARQQGTRERGKEKRKKGSDKPTSPQRKGHPPLLQGAGSRSPHHKFAPKNQQKVAWGGFEKIFGKIFRGNVSG